PVLDEVRPLQTGGTSTTSPPGKPPMSSDGSITHLITRLKEGDRAAAEGLWRAYFHRLVGLARTRLRGATRLADEEDVALSAFDSFCRGVDRGRFPALE